MLSTDDPYINALLSAMIVAWVSFSLQFNTLGIDILLFRSVYYLVYRYVFGHKMSYQVHEPCTFGTAQQPIWNIRYLVLRYVGEDFSGVRI